MTFLWRDNPVLTDVCWDAKLLKTAQWPNRYNFREICVFCFPLLPFLFSTSTSGDNQIQIDIIVQHISIIGTGRNNIHF